MRPLQYLIVLGVLLVALFVVQRPVPRSDLFAAIPAGRQVRFDRMTEPELYAAKLAHGRAAARYAVGLFGNSRAVMVGADDLGAGAGRFFNFAVPGSSFRTSVALAEDLARAGKLPSVVLISLDHLDIQFDGNPNTRGLGGWLRRLWRDVAAAFDQEDIGLRTGLRASWRHFYVGWTGLKRYFNAEQLAIALHWHLSGEGAVAWWQGAPRAGGSGYRRDGSRTAGNPKTRRVPGTLATAAPSVLVDYLREDLRRLARLRQGGTRIIVYEAPVHAASRERAARRPTPHAAAMRAAFLRQCRHLGLECRGHEAAATVARSAGWHDPSHPPAKALADYLRSLISRSPAKAHSRAAPRPDGPRERPVQ